MNQVNLLRDTLETHLFDCGTEFDGGKRKIILKLLNRKLGNLSTELMARIESLSIERLDTLSEALLDFQIVDDLIVCLDEN
jgi:hypothetical protein